MQRDAGKLRGGVAVGSNVDAPSASKQSSKQTAK
jgi:hypothetical protein